MRQKCYNIGIIGMFFFFGRYIFVFTDMQSLLNLIPLTIWKFCKCKAQELEIHEMRHTLDKAGPWLSLMSCWTWHAMMVRWEGNLRFNDQRHFRWNSLKVNLQHAPLAGSFEGLFGSRNLPENRSNRRAHSSPCFANNCQQINMKIDWQFKSQYTLKREVNSQCLQTSRMHSLRSVKIACLFTGWRAWNLGGSCAMIDGPAAWTCCRERFCHRGGWGNSQRLETSWKRVNLDTEIENVRPFRTYQIHTSFHNPSWKTMCTSHATRFFTPRQA